MSCNFAATYIPLYSMFIKIYNERAEKVDFLASINHHCWSQEIIVCMEQKNMHLNVCGSGDYFILYNASAKNMTLRESLQVVDELRLKFLREQY